MSIISAVSAILIPAVHVARNKARELRGMSNQNKVVAGVNLYSLDNNDRYPPSIAKVGSGQQWNWTDPTKLAGSELTKSGTNHAVSTYLRKYISAADAICCPSAPYPYTYLEKAWLEGDVWDNPDTPVCPDVVGGTYCLYWNYQGYMEGKLFQGPRSSAGGRGVSKLLISDYLGINHWRAPDATISCERFPNAEVVPETLLLSSLWSGPKTEEGQKTAHVSTLRAGFTDGHVESYSSMKTVSMRVIKDPYTFTPYSDDEPGPGIFFLPRSATSY